MPFGPWPGGVAGAAFPGFGVAEPAQVSPPDGGAVGVAATASRSDHKHDGPKPTTYQSGAAIGPADPVTFTTPNHLSTRSGLFFVVAHLGADASAVSTQVIDGGADGGAFLGRTKAGTGGAGPFNGAVSFVVQLAAGVNHTFYVSANASAGNNTIIANSAQISVIEF